MNDDTILALGGFCSELLSDERFDALLAFYKQQCAADLFATETHATKQREQLYAAYLGFDNFIGLMRKFAEGADKISKKINAENTPDRDEFVDDPSVHDIYHP